MPCPTDHRPWPVPDRPWILSQDWRDLLFAHWPVPRETLRLLVPPSLALDAHHGQTWMAVTPFRATATHARFLPSLPWASDFPELNVRTYVVVGDKPGVYFFSLDAGSWAAVIGARAFFNLPYFKAEMSAERLDGTIRYASRRVHPGAPSGRFEAQYRPTAHASFHAERGSLEYFLTERYCLYVVGRDGHLYRGEIHHPPWPLRRAEAEIIQNTMGEASGVQLPDVAAHLLFADLQRTLIWPLERVASTS